MLKPAEVADQLNVCTGTLSAWRRKKRGPKYIAVGAGVRYRQEDIDTWLKQREFRKIK